MSKLLLDIEYIQEPQCIWNNCGCIWAMIKNIEKKIEWTLSPQVSKKLKETTDWWILFTWACGKANHIIGITINNIIHLCNEEETEEKNIIKKYKLEITQAIEKFKQQNNHNDPYVKVFEENRNKDIGRLDISFVKWISEEQKIDLINQYNNKKNL
jgi:hypothetical protein